MRMVLTDAHAAGRGLSRRQQHPSTSEAAGAAKKGDLEPDAMRVRLLADHVAAMAPRLA
jgi:hypothetical protein